MTIPAWNAIVGSPRWTTKAAFSATTEAAGYPATNLGTLPLAYPWRSTGTDAADTVLTAVFSGSKRKIELAVLCRHNLSIGSTVTVTLYEDTAMTTVLTTATVEAWPAVFTEEQVDWDGGRWWDRTYTEEEIAGYPWHLPIRLPGAYYCQAVRVEISDPANPAGYVQVGLLELASEHQVPTNPEVGAQYGYASRTEVQEADGGTEYHRRRPKGRVFEGSVPYMPRDTAMGTWLEMRRQLDVDVPFFWWPDPTDQLHRLRRSFLARFAELSLQSYATPTDRDGVPISLKEVL